MKLGALVAADAAAAAPASVAAATAAAAAWLQSPEEAGDPPGTFRRTSFTMSAGDLKTSGGSGGEDSLLGACRLLGGL